MSKFTCLVLYVVAASLSSVHLTGNGDYELDTGLKNLRQFMKDDEKYNKLAAVAKECSSVALNISKISVGAEGKDAFLEAAKPHIEACSKEHGVSIDALKSAKAAGSIDGIKPCFLACVYKKAEVFNSKGDFVLDNALIQLKKYVSNDEDFAKFADIGKRCASVNEKPVSDGEAGCERGALLTACFLEHRAEIPI